MRKRRALILPSTSILAGIRGIFALGVARRLDCFVVLIFITFFPACGLKIFIPANQTAATSQLTGVSLIYSNTSAPYYNANIFSDAQAFSGWDGVTPAKINVTINAGVTIGSTNTSSASLVTNWVGSQNFPSGTTIQVTNKGSIVGAGGAGANGDGFPTGTMGGSGGHAFSITYPIELSNTGLIAGGGGGGGGSTDDGLGGIVGGPGGGGAGSIPGNSPLNGDTISGQSGTATLGGAGGNDCGSNGGTGGNLGYSGTSGGNTCVAGGVAGGAGGPAGFAILGTEYITNNWKASGSYLGNNSNTASGSTQSYGLGSIFAIISGNNQNGGSKGRTLGAALVAQLTDDGIPISGIPVSWTLNGNALSSGCTTTTDAMGEVSCSGVVTGTDATVNTIIATAVTNFSNLTATFTALSNSVCTGATVTLGAVCNGAYSGAIYAGDFNGYEYIVQPADTGSNVQWAASNISTTGTSQTYGGTNVAAFISQYGVGFGSTVLAAGLCYSLSGDHGWYLPAMDELQLLYQNRTAIAAATGATAFGAGNYWTSTDAGRGAFQVNFTNGNAGTSGNKYYTDSVRCVRRL